ncbi:MAG: hypothetical protein ACRELZ_01230 [Candidatus Rokuibacteriota bacterium]
MTEKLLRELETSPTDLKRLVIIALWRQRAAVAVEADAIARWERDDPSGWTSVQAWLLGQGIAITVLRSRPAAPAYRASRSASPQPPASGLHA